MTTGSDFTRRAPAGPSGFAAVTTTTTVHQSPQQNNHNNNYKNNKRPEHLHYDYLENHFLYCINTGHPFLFDPLEFDRQLRHQSETLHVPYECLLSLIRNLSLRHVKKTSPKVKARLQSYYLPQYNHHRVSILQLAQQAHYPPYLFARFIVEAVVAQFSAAPNNNNNHQSTKKNPNQKPNKKKGVTDAMRDPQRVLACLEQIAPEFHASEELFQQQRQQRQQQEQQQLQSSQSTNVDFSSANLHNSPTAACFGTRLAYEVNQAIQADPMYGPMLDKQRHLVGIEYEVVLEYLLRKLDIPFETEEDLREKGTARTPDILLSCPIAIPAASSLAAGTGALHNNTDLAASENRNPKEWNVICWIDSKALFGDVYTHNTSVLPQAESYVHRFGPGLVLYWFGHAPIERLLNAGGDVHIAGWQLPSHIMLTNGKVICTTSAGGGHDNIDQMTMTTTTGKSTVETNNDLVTEAMTSG
ncbi:hypothetical protein ACA910_018842 [Epithemia clementina (nom. ined.)]